jgi:hypothetical protein
MMAKEIIIPELSDSERIWLEAIYPRNLSCQRFTVRDIWSKLFDSLPAYFRPEQLDPRLVTAGATRIQLLGIVALEKNCNILATVNRVVEAIKAILLKEPRLDRIPVSRLSEVTDLDYQKVSFILRAIRDYGEFYRTFTMEPNQNIPKDIDVGGNDEIFYKYVNFQTLKLSSFDTHTKSGAGQWMNLPTRKS